MVTVDLFIRTWKNDIPWLKYCLQSIQKYATGYRNVVITIPSGQRDSLNLPLTVEKVYTCGNYSNDYLGQQVTKMEAFNYTDADFIIFMDSDCIFTQPFTPETIMKDGKPIILKTHYTKVGDAICWQKPTEKALVCELSHEYMRRHPNAYYSEDLRAAWSNLQAVHRMLPQDYVLRQERFSEFNYLGAFMEKTRPEKYAIIDTDSPEFANVINPVKQYWSWGGITPEIQKDIESKL